MKNVRAIALAARAGLLGPPYHAIWRLHRATDSWWQRVRGWLAVRHRERGDKRTIGYVWVWLV